VAKIYDLGRVLVLFMDGSRNSLISSGPATSRKGEIYNCRRKMMVPIVWNPQGFHLFDALPKGKKFHANYYIDRILEQLLESRSIGHGVSLIIHADNARPHIARKISNCAGKTA
jgi:hypothetical protein